MTSRPLVGVAAVIRDRECRILMGLRQGSHGAGTWAFPGGHLEFSESFEECAKREALEETGLDIGEMKFLAATNDYMRGEGKHYVTIFMSAVIVGEKKEPEAMEPDKCARWEWVDWKKMWNWAKVQAEEEEGKGAPTGNRLFIPIVDLYRQRPDMGDAPF